MTASESDPHGTLSRQTGPGLQIMAWNVFSKAVQMASKLRNNASLNTDLSIHSADNDCEKGLNEAELTAFLRGPASDRFWQEVEPWECCSQASPPVGEVISYLAHDLEDMQTPTLRHVDSDMMDMPAMRTQPDPRWKENKTSAILIWAKDVAEYAHTWKLGCPEEVN